MIGEEWVVELEPGWWIVHGFQQTMDFRLAKRYKSQSAAYSAVAYATRIRVYRDPKVHVAKKWPATDHLTDCQVDGCDDCSGLMEYYQTCDLCHSWGHDSTMNAYPASWCPPETTPSTCSDSEEFAVLCQPCADSMGMDDYGWVVELQRGCWIQHGHQRTLLIKHAKRYKSKASAYSALAYYSLMQAPTKPKVYEV